MASMIGDFEDIVELFCLDFRMFCVDLIELLKRKVKVFGKVQVFGKLRF